MQKRIKVTLYIILILVIIAVVRLMFGKKNPNIDTPIDNSAEIVTGEEIEDDGNSIEFEDTDVLEDDVMKDLEGLFGSSNGYENVEGEYGFINIDEEE